MCKKIKLEKFLGIIYRHLLILRASRLTEFKRALYKCHVFHLPTHSFTHSRITSCYLIGNGCLSNFQNVKRNTSNMIFNIICFHVSLFYFLYYKVIDINSRRLQTIVEAIEFFLFPL